MTEVKTGPRRSHYIGGNSHLVFATPMSIDVRPGILIGVPIASGAVAFAALLSKEATVSAGEPFLMLLLPAALVGMLLVAFVLMPLWCLFARRANARARFMLVAALLWLLACGALIAATGFGGESAMHDALAILIPGLILIAVFGLLADQRGLAAPRPMLSDGPQAPSAQAGQAVSPPGPAPVEAPFPGSARAGD